jgi:hypothetical protein
LVATNTTTTAAPLQDEDGYHVLLLERKVETVTSGLPSEYSKLLYRIAEDYALTICHYITSMKTEVNLSDNYRKSLVKVFTSSCFIIESILFLSFSKALFKNFIYYIL